VSTRPAPPSSRAKYLDAAELAHVAEVGRVVDPRARYLRLLQAWVECLPHQPAKRRFIEGALTRTRAGAVR
jgi:hypothetical protein